MPRYSDAVLPVKVRAWPEVLPIQPERVWAALPPVIETEIEAVLPSQTWRAVIVPTKAVAVTPVRATVDVETPEAVPSELVICAPESETLIAAVSVPRETVAETPVRARDTDTPTAPKEAVAACPESATAVFGVSAPTAAVDETPEMAIEKVLPSVPSEVVDETPVRAAMKDVSGVNVPVLNVPDTPVRATEKATPRVPSAVVVETPVRATLVTLRRGGRAFVVTRRW